MSNVIESFKHAGLTINIVQDEDPQNPREEDCNVGKMVCFHKRYTLGDKDHGFKQSDYSTWAELRAAIETDNDVAVCLPIYMYDHSGITINTTGFSCPWDSGQIGFIFCTNKQVREEWSGDNERAAKYLVGEVETYDQFLRGDVYCYDIVGTDESCCGFYGLKYAIEEAKSAADAHAKYAKKQARAAAKERRLEVAAQQQREQSLFN
jgi:hypothetical protein